jgi:hypothetical protein
MPRRARGHEPEGSTTTRNSELGVRRDRAERIPAARGGKPVCPLCEPTEPGGERPGTTVGDARWRLGRRAPAWSLADGGVEFRFRFRWAIDRVVARSLHQRMTFYVWSCIGCPLIGWSTAVFGTHGEGGVAKFVFLFIGLPVLLALVAARLLDRRVGDAVLGTVAAGALGALTWFLTILWLASQGVFE